MGLIFIDIQHYFRMLITIETTHINHIQLWSRDKGIDKIMDFCVRIFIQGDLNRIKTLLVHEGNLSAHISVQLDRTMLVYLHWR